MLTLTQSQTIPTPVTRRPWNSSSKSVPSDAFEVDEMPETVTVIHGESETGLLIELNKTLIVTHTAEDARALGVAGLAAISRVYDSLPFAMSTSGCAPCTIEKLGRSADCTVFLLGRDMPEESISAVEDTVASLRAAGILSRTFSMPFGQPDATSWLKQAGAERVKQALSDAANRTKSVNTERVLQGGFIPLGKIGKSFMCWSNDFAEIQELSISGYAQPGTLMALAGEGWLTANYPKKNDRGQLVSGFDALKAGGDLRDACAKIRSFDTSRIRLSGVWKEGDKYVVNSSEAWFVEDGAQVIRVGQKVYAAGKDLGITPDTPIATVSDGEAILDFLHTFRWNRQARRGIGRVIDRALTRQRDTDPLMLLGTLFCMYLCASLPQRPHSFVHAEPGSGKSVLLTFFRLMLGDAALSSSGSSGAGLAHEFKRHRACVASILDESGYDNKHVESLLEYLKLSYDGKKKQMGSSDQNGVEFNIRTMCLLAGTVTPALGIQLDTRTNLHRMLKWTGPRHAHRFFTDGDDAENPVVTELGKRVFARALHHAPRYERAVALLKSLLPANGRAANTLVPGIAGSFCMLFDEEITPTTAALWLERFDLDDDIQRVSGPKIGDEILDYILGAQVNIVERNGKDESAYKISMSDLIVRARDDSDRGTFRQNLGAFGIRVDGDSTSASLGIAGKSQGFKRLMATSQWSRGDMDALVHLIPGCSATKLKGSIGGISEQYNTFPWPTALDDQAANAN